MYRLAIWLMLGAVYGGVLYLLVQAAGEIGIAIWLVFVVVAQFLLSRVARSY